MTTQVFGPNRPAAARAAIREVAAAREAADSYAGFGPDSVYLRLRNAEAARAQYAEYGDTFSSH